MPLISVIIPVYNVEDYLERCVDSVLHQTYTDLEIWLVDDGSTDRCGVICDQYSSEDPRIHVIHKKNGGLSDARNYALDVASGDYICFVDSDDWIPEDSLKTMLTSIQKMNADLAIGNMIRVYDDGEKKDGYCPCREMKVIEGDEKYETLIQPCAPNRLYPSYIFQKLRYPVGRLYEDAFIYHHILGKVNRIVYTGKENYYYYIRKDSIMHTGYTSQNMDIIDAIVDRVDYLEEAGQHKIAMDTKMFVYSQLSAAYTYLDKKDLAGRKRRKNCAMVYRSYYPDLMRDPSVSFRQKVRLTVLRYAPTLHTWIWGKTMPGNLA